MGGSMTKRMQPEELAVFKKLPQNALLDEIAIPERAENRVKTDRRYLLVYGALVILLMPFLIYTLAYSDIDRLIGKIDNCGNVCGKQNIRYDQWACTGQDFRDKSMLKVEAREIKYERTLLTPKECVSSCPADYFEALIAEFCVLKRAKFNSEDDDLSMRYRYPRDIHSADHDNESGVMELGKYLRKVAWRITLACFLSLGVTLGTLYLFRWATAAMVWSLLVGLVVILSFGTIFCWVSYSNVKESQKGGLLFLSIFTTVILLIVICMMVFLAKKIRLVIALLQEAMKAAFAMPQLMFIPILTFIASSIILSLFLTTAVYMYTSGKLTELQPGFLAYEKNFAMHLTQVFNLIMTIWSLQFIVGIQYMVIAGAVAKWYFAKNKDYLDSPILTSASITFKFHLGTVAFGSMVITIIIVIRALISSAIKNRYFKVIADFCLSGLEQFLKFLSKNSFIMTAMHGKPFYKSGKRAAKIIFQNAVNVASINFIGDFILGLAQLAIVAVSLVFTYVIMQVGGADGTYQFVPYFIVFFVSLIIAVIFFAIFETVIDTIFLCFCEDSLLNDGMNRPYAMSTGLMEFMENAKKVFGEKKK